MAARTLLVEGNDDQHVVWALLKHHEVEEVFEVEKTDGVSNLLESVPVRLAVGSQVERLAVILDADEDVSSTWVSLRDRMISVGFDNIPSNISPDGTVVDLNNGIRLGVWIMPNNQLPGILEHFVQFLVPPNDPLMEYVDAFLESIPIDVRPYKVSEHAKARIHAWLATQSRPGSPPWTSDHTQVS